MIVNSMISSAEADYCLVLEDDVTLPDAFVASLSNIVAKAEGDWDFISLSASGDGCTSVVAEVEQCTSVGGRTTRPLGCPHACLLPRLRAHRLRP